MAPSRPAIYPDQIGLVIATAIVIALGIFFVVQFLIG
jgi:hypothetical protein